MISEMQVVNIGKASSKIGSGATPRGGKNSYLGGNVSLIRSLNVHDDGFQIKGLAKINDEQARSLSNVTVCEDDVLFNITGASVARCCVVPKDILPARVNQHVAIIRTNKSILNPYYLHYYLILPDVKSKLLSASGGSSREAITKNQLQGLELEVADITTQNSIAQILTSLDEKITLNNKINSELDQTARLIYDYWFTQFDFPNAQGKPYKSSGGTMVYSDQLKRYIPLDWHTVLLKDVLEFEKGTEPGSAAYLDTKYNDNYVSFYRVGDIYGDSSTFVDSSVTNLKLVKPRDVLVTFDGSVGKIGIGLDGAISSGLRHIYDKSKIIDNSFIHALFSDAKVQAEILKYSTGSVLMHASKAIDYLKVPVNMEVIKMFQNIITPMYDQLIVNSKESTSLAELRDWLLPMLMTGQVKVA